MSLSRNAAFTMGSAVAQIAVTLVTLPLYLQAIGLDRYGVLVLLWLLFEYLMLFNLGLDRAAIHLLSRYKDDAERANGLFWSALAICVATGILGAVLTYAALPAVLMNVLSVSQALVSEIGWGVAAFAAMLLVGVIATILSSLLQSHERFLEMNAAQLASSVAFQAIPVAAATLVSPTLQTVVIAGCAGRALQMLLLLAFCWRRSIRPGRPAFSKPGALSMLRYGAWTSVSGVISPIVVNLDRLLIGRLAGPAAVALYAVPYNLVMKAQLIPTSLSSALFPRLSQAGDLAGRRATAETALFALGAILGIGLIVGSFALEPFLGAWVGSLVSVDAVRAGQILILGIWFNGLAVVPYVWLQANGRPDLVAKLHALELVPFALVLWTLVAKFGIEGAAAAWSLRVIVDALALQFFARMSSQGFIRLLPSLGCVTGAVIFNCIYVGHGLLSTLLALALQAFMCIWAFRAAPPALRDRLVKVLRRLLPLRWR